MGCCQRRPFLMCRLPVHARRRQIRQFRLMTLLLDTHCQNRRQ